MGYGLDLYFKKDPRRLPTLLEDMDYVFNRVTEDSEMGKMLVYYFFKEGESSKGVVVDYHSKHPVDPTDRHQKWYRALGESPKAFCQVEVHGNFNASDVSKMIDTAFAVKNRFGAVLYDPQLDQVIRKDSENIRKKVLARTKGIREMMNGIAELYADSDAKGQRREVYVGSNLVHKSGSSDTPKTI